MRQAVQQDCAVGFLGIRQVFELCTQVVARRRVERIAQHIHEEIAQKALLILFLFGSADIGLFGGVGKVAAKAFVSGAHDGGIEISQVLLEYRRLKKGYGDVKKLRR